MLHAEVHGGELLSCLVTERGVWTLASLVTDALAAACEICHQLQESSSSREPGAGLMHVYPIAAAASLELV